MGVTAHLFLKGTLPPLGSALMEEMRKEVAKREVWPKQGSRMKSRKFYVCPDTITSHHEKRECLIRVGRTPLHFMVWNRHSMLVSCLQALRKCLFFFSPKCIPRYTGLGLILEYIRDQGRVENSL